ncbi:MAG: hypothetical protein ACLQVD_19615 [Capsulimonadaceae bacterium]
MFRLCVLSRRDAPQLRVLLALCILCACFAPRAVADGGGGIPSAVMAGLAPEDRKNVILLTGGHVVTSGRAKSRGLSVVSIPDDTSGLLIDRSGHEFAIPDVSEGPEPGTRGLGDRSAHIYKDKKTGPYHGVYAQTGYSYLQATVHLPSNAGFPPAVFTDKDSADTAYVYMGGETVGDGAVDAGLQHSATYDNWSLFLVCEGFGFTYDGGLRFASDQDVVLKFYVPANNFLALSASGKDILGNDVTRTIVLDVTHYPDQSPPAPAGMAGLSTRFHWRADGTGNVLKRLTSIAQRSQSFDTRSYVKGISWTGVRVGTSPTRNHPWTALDTSDVMNWPDPLRVRVRKLNSSDEVVNIDLNTHYR